MILKTEKKKDSEKLENSSKNSKYVDMETKYDELDFNEYFNEDEEEEEEKEEEDDDEKKEINVPLKLLKDVKTRWNSSKKNA